MGDDKSNNPPPEPPKPDLPDRRIEEPREIGLSEGKGMQALPDGDPSGLVSKIEMLPAEPPPPPPPPPPPEPPAPPVDSE